MQQWYRLARGLNFEYRNKESVSREHTTKVLLRLCKFPLLLAKSSSRLAFSYENSLISVCLCFFLFTQIVYSIRYSLNMEQICDNDESLSLFQILCEDLFWGGGIQFNIPFKIISLISRRANRYVGRNGSTPGKPPDTPASRTWLVSHVASAGLEPTPVTAVRWSND